MKKPGTTLRDAGAILLGGTLWLLVWPAGPAALLGAQPLDPELARAGGDTPLLRLLGEGFLLSPPGRGLLCLLLALAAATAADLVRRTFDSRTAGFVLAAVILTHPQTLASRLDPGAWNVVPGVVLMLWAGSRLVTSGRLLAPFILSLCSAALLFPRSTLLPLALLAPVALLRFRTLRIVPWLCALLAGALLYLDSWTLRLDVLLGALLPAIQHPAAGTSNLPPGPASLVPLILLVLLTLRPRPSRLGLRLLPAATLLPAASGILVRTGPMAEAAPGDLFPSALAVALGIAAPASLLPRTLSGRVIGGAAIGLFALTSLAADHRREITHSPLREEIAELRSALLSLPDEGPEVLDAIFVSPPASSGAVGSHLPLLFPGRRLLHVETLPDPGPGRVLRLLAWTPLTGPPSERPASRRLEPRLTALRPAHAGPELLAPADGALLVCREAGDEPTFSWTVPLDMDPGPEGFTFVALRRAREPAGGTTLLLRELDASVLRRVPTDGGVRYAWRPSIRSEHHAERELLWEYEDIAPRDSVFGWTVTMPARDGRFLMAPPRRARVLP